MKPPQIGRDEQGRVEMPWLQALPARAAALKAHAVLVHGPPGVGQLQAVLLLAQAWLCEAAPTPAAAPCGRCPGCRQVQLRSHPDLMLVVPEADQLAWDWLADDHPLRKPSVKPSRQLKIEQIREAIAFAATTSGRGRGKALVLHPAERLNEASANALLKTLEEPPARMRLLLGATDPAGLMPTLLSRCQRLPLPAPGDDEALAWLAAQGVGDPAALLKAAGGSPQGALALAEAGLGAAALQALPRALAAGLAAPLAGQALPLAVDLLLRLSHDALAMSVGGVPRYWPVDQLVQGGDMAVLVDWQRELMACARHAEHPVQAALRIEALVTNGARAWRNAAAPGRVARRLLAPSA